MVCLAFLWQLHRVNAKGPCWCEVNIGPGNSVVPSCNKLLPEANVNPVLCRYMASLGQSELTHCTMNFIKRLEVCPKLSPFAFALSDTWQVISLYKSIAVRTRILKLKIDKWGLINENDKWGLWVVEWRSELPIDIIDRFSLFRFKAMSNEEGTNVFTGTFIK